MWRTQIRDEESKIEAEKRIKYKGTARIRLKWLHFQWNQPRELDSKNVERLKADFRKDCRRLEESNHIPAVINQPSLDAAEERSRVSARQLGKYPQGGYPELVFPAGLSSRMPALTTPYPGGERVGVGLVDGRFVPRREARSLRGSYQF